MTYRHTSVGNPYAGLRFIPLSGRFAIEKAAHHADYQTLEEAMAARDALETNNPSHQTKDTTNDYRNPITLP